MSVVPFEALQEAETQQEAYVRGSAHVHHTLEQFAGFYDPERQNDPDLKALLDNLTRHARQVAESLSADDEEQIADTLQLATNLYQTAYGPDAGPSHWTSLHPRYVADTAVLSLAVDAAPALAEHFSTSPILPQHVAGVVAVLQTATRSLRRDMQQSYLELAEKIITGAGLDFTMLARHWMPEHGDNAVSHVFSNTAAILQLEAAYPGGAKQLFAAGTTRFHRSGQQLMLDELHRLDGTAPAVPQDAPRFYAALMSNCHTGAADFPGSMEILRTACQEAGIELNTTEFKSKLDLYKLALRIKWRGKLYGERVAGGVILTHGTLHGFQAGDDWITADELCQRDLSATGEAFTTAAKIGLMACGEQEHPREKVVAEALAASLGSTVVGATERVTVRLEPATSEEQAEGYLIGYRYGTLRRSAILYLYDKPHKPTVYDGSALRAAKYGSSVASSVA